MMSFIPAAGALVATVAACFYELDDPRMASIERDLAARKAGPRTDGS